MAITIDGKKVKVLSSLGYNQNIGAYVKEVEIDGARQMAVGGPGHWRLWTPRDRVAPLVEYLNEKHLNTTQ